MERTIKSIDPLEMLSSKAYLVLNKRVLEMYGPNITVFLSNLIDKYFYFRDKSMLKNNEWFFLIHKQQIKQTGMTVTEIRSCKTRLKKDGILKTKCMGIPSKEWYKLDQERILEVLEIPMLTRSKVSLSLEVKISDALTNNNKVNNTILKKTNKKSSSQLFLEYFPKEWKEDKSFQSSIKDFIIHRLQKKVSLTPISCKKLANKLLKFDRSVAIAALERSIENSWTGVFPEKEDNSQKGKSNNTFGSRRPGKSIMQYVKYDRKL